jgi:micrococcal nuclease
MYTYKCKVTKVIDGDTIDVDIQLGFKVILYKQRIRLHGIDTPESRTRDLEEKSRGLLAKEFMKELAPVGSTITLKSLDKGKFGRILGQIWRNVDSWTEDPSINDLMIINYHAVPYTGQNKDEVKILHEKNKLKLIENGVL